MSHFLRDVVERNVANFRPQSYKVYNTYDKIINWTNNEYAFWSEKEIMYNLTYFELTNNEYAFWSEKEIMYNLTYFELTYAWFIDCWEVWVVFVLVFVLSSKSHWVVKVDKCVIFTTEMCSVHGSLMVETFGWCFGLFSLVVINCIELTNEQLCRWNVWCACPISNGDVLVVFWFVCVWSSKSHWVVKSENE